MTPILADGKWLRSTAHIFSCAFSVLYKVIQTDFIAFPEHRLAKTLLGIDFITTAKLIIDILHIKFSFSDQTNVKFDLSFEYQTSNQVSVNMLNLALREYERYI